MILHFYSYGLSEQNMFANDWINIANDDCLQMYKKVE